jgi:hypothetical protein
LKPIQDKLNKLEADPQLKSQAEAYRQILQYEQEFLNNRLLK